MTAAFVAITRAASTVAKALLLLLVLLQFAVVITRYVFGANFLWAQEAALVAHGVIFMLGAGWTLVAGKHVAIDVLSSRFSASRKSTAGKLGFALLLLPMMVAILVSSAAYVSESWAILEGSQEVSGLPGIFLFKTLIPAFSVLMIMAGLAVFFRKRDQNHP